MISFIQSLSNMGKDLPRGVRNNNPMCIKRSKANKWLGEVPDEQNTDPVFEQYISPEYGIRAGAYLIIKFYRTQKINTIRKLITKWAPKHDKNDTESYINFVSRRTSIPADEPVDFTDFDVLKSVVEAIIAFECAGYRYPDHVITRGLEMVGVVPKNVQLTKTRSGKTAIGLGLAGLASLSANDVIQFYSSLSWLSDIGGYIAFFMFIFAVLIALLVLKYGRRV